jgi:magnesium-transporting ATPase (P-type)
VGDKTQGFFASKRMANLTNPHCKSVEEVLKFYQVTPEQGLSSTQVEEYRAKYGPNALEEQEKLSRIRDLEDQLVIICCLLFGGMGVHP